MIGTLHRKAPIWRTALWGAVALTIASWLPGGGGQNQPPGQGSGATSGGGGAAVGGQQAPIAPVAPAPTIPPESQRRLQVFSNEVREARSESREGARCERIATAFSAVLPEDHQHATGALANARDEGLACRARLGQSDARLTELETRARAFSDDATPATAEAVARARQALTAFDRSRVAMDRFAESDRIGEAAGAMLAQSDARLAAFGAAHAAWRGDRTPGAATERELARATQALTPFDKARLPPAQAGALAEANDLAAELSGSERRLEDLTVALAAAQADPEGAADRLLDANGAVLPGDAARADATQRPALEAAATRSRNLALARLMERSAQFRANPNDPAAVASLLRLRPALAGVEAASLTPEQQAALSDLDRAAVWSRDSDRRIAALGRALQAFDNNRSRLTGDALLEALKAVGDFDRRRQTAAQAALTERAEAAAAVARAPQVPRARWASEVPVFVVGPPGDDGPLVAGKVQAAVREAGFRMAPTRPDAGLVVEIQPLDMGQAQPVLVGNMEVMAILASGRARLLWGVDGSQIGASISGEVQSRGAAERDARRNAALALANRLAGRVADALR